MRVCRGVVCRVPFLSWLFLSLWCICTYTFIFFSRSAPLFFSLLSFPPREKRKRDSLNPYFLSTPPTPLWTQVRQIKKGGGGRWNAFPPPVSFFFFTDPVSRSVERKWTPKNRKTKDPRKESGPFMPPKNKKVENKNASRFMYTRATRFYLLCPRSFPFVPFVHS